MYLIAEAPTNDPYAGIIASVFSNDVGSRLVWHTDDGYPAAFAAYLSPKWPETLRTPGSARSSRPHSAAMSP
jgi:hypothetical protein